jgi:hypothetical protein
MSSRRARRLELGMGRNDTELNGRWEVADPWDQVAGIWCQVAGIWCQGARGALLGGKLLG